MTEGFAVRMYMEVGKMGLTLEEIKKRKKERLVKRKEKIKKDWKCISMKERALFQPLP